MNIRNNFFFFFFFWALVLQLCLLWNKKKIIKKTSENFPFHFMFFFFFYIFLTLNMFNPILQGSSTGWQTKEADHFWKALSCVWILSFFFLIHFGAFCFDVACYYCLLQSLHLQLKLGALWLAVIRQGSERERDRKFMFNKR